MARIHTASLGPIEPFAVGTHGLEQGLDLAVHEMLEDLAEGALDHLIIERVIAVLPELLGRCQEDHGHSVALGLSGLRVDLRREELRVPVVHQNKLVQRLGPLHPESVVVGPGVFREGYGAERLGEEVPSLPEWAAVAGHFEEHPTVGVEAVVLHEFDAATGGVQPFLSLLHFVVEDGHEPGEPAELPDRLIGAEEGPVGVEVVEEPAVLPVGIVLHPERDCVFQQTVTVGLDQVLDARPVHSLDPLSCGRGPTGVHARRRCRLVSPRSSKKAPSPALREHPEVPSTRRARALLAHRRTHVGGAGTGQMASGLFAAR